MPSYLKTSLRAAPGPVPEIALQSRRHWGRWATAVVLSASAASLGFWAAGASAEERALAGFQAVKVEGSVKMRIQAGAFRVDVRTDRQEDIQTRVDTLNGVPTLVVSPSGRWLSWGSSKSATPEVTVQMPALQAVELAGSGDVDVDLQGLTSPKLRLAVAGSGDLNARGVQADQVEVSVAGSGDVRAAGKAQTISVAVAGSGDAWLQDLQAQEADVSVAGSGDAKVHVLRRLAVSVAGSGDVRYRGDPPHVRSVVRGSGTVKKF